VPRQKPQSEAELWKMLGKSTRRSLTPGECNWLIDEGWVRTALHSGEAGGYTECLAALRRFRRELRLESLKSGSDKSRQSPRRSRSRHRIRTGWCRDEELARCQVMSRHFARAANQSFHVRRMRRLLLGGENAILTSEDAQVLLDSPAARFLGPRFFEKHGIPLLDHRSSIQRSRPHFDESAMTLSQDLELELKWPAGQLVESIRVLRNDMRTGYRPRELKFQSLGGRETRLEVHPESWFWILLSSCNQLTFSYPWAEPEIVWFILTGMPPAIEPISARTEVMYGEDDAEPTLATITLRAFPFVSEDSILRAYRLNRLLLSGAMPVRPVPVHNLWLFDFVEERRISKKPPNWTALMKEWNHERPEWRKNHRSQFRHDYMRTRDQLITPKYRETL